MNCLWFQIIMSLSNCKRVMSVRKNRIQIDHNTHHNTLSPDGKLLEEGIAQVPWGVESVDDLLHQRFNWSDGLEGHHRSEAGLHNQLHIARSYLVCLHIDRTEFEFFEELERMFQVHPGDMWRVGFFRSKPTEMSKFMFGRRFYLAEAKKLPRMPGVHSELRPSRSSVPDIASGHAVWSMNRRQMCDVSSILRNILDMSVDQKLVLAVVNPSAVFDFGTDLHLPRLGFSVHVVPDKDESVRF